VRTFDTIVVGLGAMGGAAACQLARRGGRVLGLDRFRPPHGQGSSAGRTRIIREAYFEHPAYVPLVRRAYDAWRALERDARRELLRTTGGLMIGPASGPIVAGALRSAREHGLAHEQLDAASLARRWPVLRPDAHHVGVFEPRAGVLFPEACVAAHLEGAVRAGAELRFDEPARGWDAHGDSLRVHTGRGTYEAGALVLAPGAWLPELRNGIALPLAIRRQTVFWLASREPAAVRPDRLPIFIWEHDPGRFIYGFPDFGDGFKLARHGEGEPTDADRARRTADASEAAELLALAERYMPPAAGPVREASACLYSCTPDAHFVIDAHPAHPRAIVASICSGHGFKFASAMGEVLADLATATRPRFDLKMFRLDRFAPG
jgi:sarcosine oxidase